MRVFIAFYSQVSRVFTHESPASTRYLAAEPYRTVLCSYMSDRILVGMIITKLQQQNTLYL